MEALLLTRFELWEKHLFKRVLKKFKGVQRHTANYLGLSERTIRNKCSKYCLGHYKDGVSDRGKPEGYKIMAKRFPNN